MRTLLALILSALLPARGMRRAETVQTTPARRLPASRPLATTRAPRPVDVIEADGLPLVRPYVLAYEREREAQRERRTAAALATFGIDYPYGPQGRAA